MNIDLHVAPGLTALISRALILNASDINVTAHGGDIYISVRVDGDLRPLMEQTPHERRELIKEIKGTILGNEFKPDAEKAAAIFHLSREGKEQVRVRLGHEPYGSGVMILMRLLRLAPAAAPVPLYESVQPIRSLKEDD